MSSAEIAILEPRDVIVVDRPCIPPMSDEAIAKVYQFEDENLAREQVPIVTHHMIHGGQYHRWVLVPAGVTITGALIKIPTTLTVCGDATVYIGDESLELAGFHVVPAAAERKQAIRANKDTYLLMTFATDAKNVDEAERHFTHEFYRLMSNSDPALNRTTITGE